MAFLKAETEQDEGNDFPNFWLDFKMANSVLFYAKWYQLIGLFHENKMANVAWAAASL